MDNNKELTLDERMTKALLDENCLEKGAAHIKAWFNGKEVNKDPIKNVPKYDMRLYCIDDKYFKSIDEVFDYCRKKGKSLEELSTLDYYRSFANCEDVIIKQDSISIKIYTVVDQHGYVVYDNQRSIYTGKFIWEYQYGSIKNFYDAFRNKGVVFKDDIYAKIEEEDKHFLELSRNWKNRKKLN